MQPGAVTQDPVGPGVFSRTFGALSPDHSGRAPVNREAPCGLDHSSELQ